MTEQNSTLLLIDSVSVSRGSFVLGPVSMSVGAGLAGQFAVFGPEGPCYSCLFPAPPPVELIPPATQRGVLGAICGIVGSAMAAELLLWLLERRPEATRLVQLDLATGESRSLVAEARPGCRCQHETPDLRRSMPIKEPEKEETR